MGIQEKNDSTKQTRYRLMWMDVKYEPGTVRVVAYDNDGNVAEEKEIHTSGMPYQLILTPDRTELSADGKDLAYVTVSVVDKNGHPCPDAVNQLNFKVSGKGSYRAACNGDATSLELFHLPTMKLFSGKLVVTVQTTNEKGDIDLKVSGKGLKSASIKLKSK